MDEQKVRLIGLDPGASAVRAAEVHGTKVLTSIVPSIVGVGDTNVGALNLAGVGRGSRKGAQPDRIAFDGAEYLVGEHVIDYAKPIERIDFDRFTDGPELRALIYRALAGLSGTSNLKSIAMVIGMPVEIMEDAEQATAVERGMKNWLLGQHHFELNGEPHKFEVVSLKAKIAQPVGTWFNWGLDNTGQWTRGNTALKAPTLIIDEGFSTLDIFAVSGGQISRRNTDGATLGMRRACEMIGELIERHTRVEVGLHEANALIFEVTNGHKAQLYVAGELTDVTAEVNQALNAIATDVIRFIDKAVDGGRKFKVLITGGGAEAIADRLMRSLPHAEVMPEPRLSNVIGLAKLAQRSGFLI